MATPDEGEVWLPVPGYEATHQVSDRGRVRTRAGRVLAMRIMPNGYLRLRLCAGGKRTAHSIHRLVAAAFIPNPLGLSETNHLDGDKTNNAPSNLEWCDHSHNQRHAIRTGLTRVPRGAERAWAKLDDEKVRAIRQRIADGVRYTDISTEFSIARCKITMIKQRKAWGHVV